MSKQHKQRVHTAQLYYDGTKLCFRNKQQKAQFEEFQKDLAKNQSVELHYMAAEEEGTLTMLARIHAAIGVIANETGVTKEELKKQVKRQGGYMSGADYLSFGDMSLKRLQQVFQTVCEVGDFVGTNVR